MKKLSFEQLRKIAIITWVISFGYFVYLISSQDVRDASKLSLPDKFFCWIFVFHTLALAEIVILGIRGVERNPRTVLLTVYMLLAYVVCKVIL